MSGRKCSLCFGTVNTDRAKRDRKKLHGNACTTELFVLKKVLYLRGQDLTSFVELNDRDALLCKCCLSLLSTVKRCDEELNRTLAQIHSKLNVVHAFPPVSSSMAPVIPQIVPPVDPQIVPPVAQRMVPPVAQPMVPPVPQPMVPPVTQPMVPPVAQPMVPPVVQPMVPPVVQQIFPPVAQQMVPPVEPRMVTTVTCQMVPPVAPRMAISTVPRMAPSVAPHTIASEESPVSPCILSPVISPVVPAHNTPIGHSSSIRRTRKRLRLDTDMVCIRLYSMCNYKCTLIEHLSGCFC